MCELTKPLLVYVCSPLSGDIEHNVRLAHEYCAEVLRLGHYPLCSHGLTFMAYGQVSEEAALAYSTRLVGLCDVLWLPERAITRGMKVEIDVAKSINLPIIDGVTIVDYLTEA